MDKPVFKIKVTTYGFLFPLSSISPVKTLSTMLSNMDLSNASSGASVLNTFLNVFILISVEFSSSICKFSSNLFCFDYSGSVVKT